MELLSLSTEYDVIQKGLSAREINCKEDPYKQRTLILGYAKKSLYLKAIPFASETPIYPPQKKTLSL